MIVLGLDIVKGNPLSHTSPPIYSVVVIDESGKVITETMEATLNAVIRLAWDYNVNRIGIDNIYELAPTSKHLAKIFSLFPSYTEVYQVTLDNNTFVNIVAQASKIGISLHSKPKPIQTAYICALLALNNIGTPIKGLERKTKIIVTRTRSYGAGGSSTNRYVRGVRTAILRAVREIKSVLEKEGLDYDLIIRKSSGGLDSATFIVYSDSEKVKAIVKPYRGKDIRIIVKPIYTDIIIPQNEVERKRPLIIGLDPGIETGLAIIDLSLNILLIESARNLDRLEIIDKIYRYGIPVLIAVDKTPPPESVKKLAATLGIQLYVPSEQLSIEMKNKLIEWLKRKKHIDIRIATTHERDALAAALRAYKAYERKLMELEKKLLEMDLDVDVDELKSMVLKGQSISNVIEYVIDKHLMSNHYIDSVIHTTHISAKQTYYDEKIKSLELRISELIKENEALRNKLRELENSIDNLTFEKRFTQVFCPDAEINRDRVLAKLNEQIRQLQNTIDNLNDKIEKLTYEKNRYLDLLLSLAKRKTIIVPRLKNLSVSSINAVKDIISLNKILAIDDSNVISNVIDYIKQSKVILLFEKCLPEIEQILLNNNIPIVCDVNIEKFGESLAFIESEELERALITAINKLHLFKKTKSLDISDVIKIISEYRSSIMSKTSSKDL